MDLLIGSAVCVALTFAIVTIHAETLDFVSYRFLPRISRPRRWHVGATVLILTAAHVVEVAVCAAAFAAAAQWLQIGRLDGASSTGVETYLYFSFSCYTSLGLGDIFPVGGLRLLAGMVSLIGLLMIGWTASYLLLEMREFRSRKRRAVRVDARRAGHP